ncbi:MAG: rRNA maturation RNase YbeY [Anaerolineae bacterium]|nr:rRNA maturation RNase YbeY [Anaerolineae bacterium]
MDAEAAQQYWVQVQVEREWPVVEAPMLHRAALETLSHQGAPPVEVTVVISDDETLQELNRRYRAVDTPTDVLAFPGGDEGPFVNELEQPHYLGDVIVSYPRAAEQAREAGHSVLAELQLLVVHGVLHLLGHDDQPGPARARMWAAQQAILEALGVQLAWLD